MRITKDWELLQELTVPCTGGAEKQAMETAALLGESLGFSAERCEDIRTAVSEACLNAIEHGNGGQDGPVRVLFHKGGGVLAIEVVDGGGGFDPASVPDAIVVPDRRRTGRIRGFGLFLIKRLSDGLDTVAGAHGHSLRMRFTLPKPVPSSSEGR